MVQALRRDLSLGFRIRAEGLPDENAREAAYRSIGEMLAKEDIRLASQWLVGMEESANKVAIASDVAGKFPATSPVEASDWMSRMPAGQTRMARD